MMIDDYKAGKLSPDDPWAVEALKRGLIQPRLKVDQWKAGALPETDPWAVEALKRGLVQPRNPYTNPDLSPKETRGFQPDPMAQTVKKLPGKLLSNADENLTKNITALTPKPSESPYGSIRMPRMSDDPENAGAFVMAGPIAVEQALSKIVAKVLPAKTIQDKLLQMGASKAELETRGVTQFLESKGARPIFPKEVAKHLEENPYQLKEVVKSSRREARQVFQLKYPDGTHVGAPFDTEKEAIAAMNDLRNPKAALGRGRQEPLSITETLSERPLNPPKFEQWQTPGGENYREILMTSPQKETVRNKAIRNTGGARPWKVFVGGEKEHQASFVTEVEAKQFLASHPTFSEKVGEKFTGGHWDEPNVVAHMRVNDRKIPSGERALHVEEWQSDWAIKLRENKAAGGGGGYSVEQMSEAGKGTDWFVYNHLGEEVAGPFKTPGEGNQWVKKVGPDVPSHPLVDNWQDLMARRTLKEAVDGGYDRLTWTTGQQQADRYDLSKQITKVTYNPKTEVLEIIDKNGEPEALGGLVKPEEIQNYIGKDVARKLLASPQHAGGPYKIDMVHSVSGLDLKMGGEWATKLYDESMVNRFNKIGKRYGVKVDEVDLTEGVRRAHKLKYAGEGGPAPKEVKAHSLKITPEMRQSIGAAKFHPFADLPGPTGGAQ